MDKKRLFNLVSTLLAAAFLIAGALTSAPLSLVFYGLGVLAAAAALVIYRRWKDRES